MLEGKSEVSKNITPPRKGPVKRLFKSFVDVKTWLSYDNLKSDVKNVWGLFRRLFSRSRREIYRETYEEAVIRLGLTSEQIVTRKKNFLYAAIVYWLVASVFVSYFIYLIINVRLFSAFFMLILTILMVLTAYQEHFWYMQMQKKKLGCNFREWLDFVLRRKG